MRPLTRISQSHHAVQNRMPIQLLGFVPRPAEDYVNVQRIATD